MARAVKVKNDVVLKGLQSKTYCRPLGCGGQVIIEFTFCMIIILLMIYGVAQIFIWSGRDLAERNQTHTYYLERNVSPTRQIHPYFYTPGGMDAIWGE